MGDFEFLELLNENENGLDDLNNQQQKLWM